MQASGAVTESDTGRAAIYAQQTEVATTEDGCAISGRDLAGGCGMEMEIFTKENGEPTRSGAAVLCAWPVGVGTTENG